MSRIWHGRMGAVMLVLATFVGGTAVVASPAGAAAAVDNFTVVSTTYSASTVSVSGLQTKLLTVTVHITDSTPLPTTDDYLGFGLGRTAVVCCTLPGTGPLTSFAVNARFVSGGGSDGVWAATFPIPSTADGVWALNWVSELGRDGHLVTGAPTFTVIGTHQPRLSVGTSPSVVPVGTSPYAVKGRVTDLSTGLGMAGVRLEYGIGDSCVVSALGEVLRPVSGMFATVTNSTGFYGFPPLTDAAARLKLNCVIAFGSAPVGAPATTRPVVLERVLLVRLSTWVSAVPSVSSAPIGTIVPVYGAVGGNASFCRVELQRLYGSSVWRRVSDSYVRSSGRFTLTAQPSLRGPNMYRAYLPSCGQYLAAKSVTRVITGT